MALVLRQGPRQVIVLGIAALMAIALAMGVAVGALFSAAGVASAAVPACVDNIAGTYYVPADFLITFNRDRSFEGQYSSTTQEAIGVAESFSGVWDCSGNRVEMQQFDFLVSGSDRDVERGNATGVFNGVNKITLTYAFHVFDENATAADLRSGTGAVVNVPNVVIRRVSTL